MAQPKKRTSPRALALEAIARIENDAAYTDIVLSQLLESHSLEQKDRALFNQLVRGIIRMKLHLDWMANQFLKNPDVPMEFRWILWLGFYQLKFLDKIPRFAAVNECVDLAKKELGPKWASVTNAVLRNYLRNPQKVKYPSLEKEVVQAISILTSHPQWLVKRFVEQMNSDEAFRFCTHNNQTPGVSVRVSPELKNDFRIYLESKQLDFQESKIPNYFKLTRFTDNVKSEWLGKGLISVQDESAALVGHLVDPQPGELICDVCAAPGGKSLHMAELGRGKATILSGDINYGRVQLVGNDVKRTRRKSVNLIVADAANFPAKQADKVLLDAPCSGLGVLSKKPDLRWQRVSKDIKDLVLLQTKLLNRANDLVKTGGYVIYSTCTILKEENEKIVDSFLKQNRNFKLVEIPTNEILKDFIVEKYYIRTWPHLHDMDGSFAVKMLKTD